MTDWSHTPDWSILVATVPSRLRVVLPTLIEKLRTISGDRPVEILWFGDNKWRCVGAKRNALLSLARGDYVSFFDDDDWPADDYVTRIHDAIVTYNREPDVICFEHICTIDGGDPILCSYSVDLEYSWTGPRWTGKPAHTCCWRRALIQDVRFPEANIGEDMDWVRTATARVENEVQLRGEPLYHYNCRADRSETRGAGLLRDVPLALQAWWEQARAQ